jgi:hypothetical protein
MWRLGRAVPYELAVRRRERLTLNSNMDVILRLLGLSCVFVGFGEGVYSKEC